MKIKRKKNDVFNLNLEQFQSEIEHVHRALQRELSKFNAAFS